MKHASHVCLLVLFVQLSQIMAEVSFYPDLLLSSWEFSANKFRSCHGMEYHIYCPLLSLLKKTRSFLDLMQQSEEKRLSISPTNMSFCYMSVIFQAPAVHKICTELTVNIHNYSLIF